MSKQKSGAVKHKLTIEEMPSHNHRIISHNNSGEITSWPFTSVNGKYLFEGSRCEYTGGDKAHENMQPYYVLNMWIRIN